MQFGKTLGEACATFAITNIDDLFVLITFFAEATTSRVLTPWKIVIGQYIGFTIIVCISMIGFGLSLVLPSEPIGFLGLFPILLGVWKFSSLFLPQKEQETEVSTAAGAKGIFKVTLITLMNGGDNIGTYIPGSASRNRSIRCSVLHSTRSAVFGVIPGHETEAYPGIGPKICRLCHPSPLHRSRDIHHHQVGMLSLVYRTYQ